jgi:hypothetical protein
MRHTAQNSLAVSSTSEPRVAKVLSRWTGRDEVARLSGRMPGFTMLGQIDVQCQCFCGATRGLQSLVVRLCFGQQSCLRVYDLCTHAVGRRCALSVCMPCVRTCVVQLQRRVGNVSFSLVRAATARRFASRVFHQAGMLLKVF